MVLLLTLLFGLIRNTLKSQYEMSPGLIDVFLIEEVTGQTRATRFCTRSKMNSISMFRNQTGYNPQMGH